MRSTISLFWKLAYDVFCTDDGSVEMLDFDDIKLAHTRIRPFIHETPILKSESLNNLSGAELFFKCENFQKTGAFKARGATNAVLSLSKDAINSGVATHSSGNHGAALAWAAATSNMRARIIVPENTKQVKKDAIVNYGGEIIECASNLKSREETLQQLVKDTGAYFVPPYDDEQVISGQGTAALEILEQVEDVDIAIIPVGGGGLLAGCLLGFSEDKVTTYGVEPEGADDAYRSLQTGERIPEHNPNTICDGLRTTLGSLNFPIIQNLVKDILLVTDDEVVRAMYLLWTRLKIIIEPSCAVPLAGLLRNKDLFSGKRVAIILSGGNVDLTQLPFH